MLTRKNEEKKAKEANLQAMNIRFLQEVPYNKSCRKGELVEKVKRARMENEMGQLHENAHQIEPRRRATNVIIDRCVQKTTHQSSAHSHCQRTSTKKERPFMIHYFSDERKERLLHLLLHIHFLLEMFASYLDIITYSYVMQSFICWLHSYIFCLQASCSQWLA